MTPIQIQKLIKSFRGGDKKQLVIQIDSNNFRRGLAKSRELLEKMEREMRIQKLELAVKRLNINRSWL